MGISWEWRVASLAPMGKPRMTRRDRWAKRPCVEAYWVFKDALRASVLPLEGDIFGVSWWAYLPMPKSWSKKKKIAMSGKPHRQTPDLDNIYKAILDALFEDDSRVYLGHMAKYWEDVQGPRIELKFHVEVEDGKDL